MPKAKTAKLSPIVGKIVDLLTPLTSDDRAKAISAARTLLGESAPIKESRAKGGEEETDDEVDTFATSGKAKTWQKQNGITGAELAQVFHSDDGKTEVIAGSMPGTKSREQTLNAYVLTGIAQLLAKGEPKFTDEDARALCTTAGCYDSTNHAKSLKNKGNWFTGSKKTGWTLTAPGLKQGAIVIKSLASAPE